MVSRMYDPSDFNIRISRGSSLEDIRKKLQGKHEVFLADSIEFLVTTQFDIFLHHTCSHLELERDSGVARDDIIASGNSSFDPRDKHRDLIVRFKCGHNPERWRNGVRVPDDEYSVEEHKYLDMMNAAEKRVQQFTAPLRAKAS
jgi:hypothetical protein